MGENHPVCSVRVKIRKESFSKLKSLHMRILKQIFTTEKVIPAHQSTFSINKIYILLPKDNH